MSTLTFYTLLPQAIWVAFMFAYGACVGSLINVLVYRLPRGMGVVRPASRCPSCQTRLTFRENIPVLGWILLRGRCRFCKQPISPEYPIVETVVGLLFVLLYLVFYGFDELAPRSALAMLQPEWAMNGLGSTWPILLVYLILVGSLVAITLIDARTAQIPLVLVWTPALVALLIHTAHAAFVQVRHGNPAFLQPGIGWKLADGTRWFAAPGHVWSLPTAGVHDWWFVGSAMGGAAGLAIAVVLLELGLIRRSFADYDEWEKAERARQASESSTSHQDEPADADAPVAGAADDAEIWIQYPHARREMLKEIAFVALPLGLGVVGAWFAPWLVEQTVGPWKQASPYAPTLVPPINVPLWLSVLSGVLAGYLFGGGIVWAIRILGSLAFGKEALGLGDVHLVAAIGACAGWIDAVLGFFGAAFVGLAWTLLAGLMRGKLGRTLPYGPYIAIATLLIIIAKPGVEWFLGRLTGMQINLP